MVDLSKAIIPRMSRSGLSSPDELLVVPVKALVQGYKLYTILPIIKHIIVHFSLSLFFYSFMCTILFICVYYSILFTSCPYFVYCVFVYFVYSSIQPLAAILQ